jgi:UrcA family protein
MISTQSDHHDFLICVRRNQAAAMTFPDGKFRSARGPEYSCAGSDVMKIRTTLLAVGAFGALATTAAVAQDYYDNGPGEEVIVVAPDYYTHRPYPSHVLGRPPDRTTMSMSVSYSDLDLTTRNGAHELRARVRDAARDICSELASQYPVRMVESEPCLKNAIGTGLNRANMAISDKRQARGDYYAY